MNNLHIYQVRFFDSQGVLLEVVPLSAESLAVATDCANAIGADIGAADFAVTSQPDPAKPACVVSGRRSAGLHFMAYGLFALFAASIIISLWA